MKKSQRSILTLCLGVGLLTGGQALAQVTSTTPNGDVGMVSTPSMQNDTQLSTPTNGAARTGPAATNALTPTETQTESRTEIRVDMPDIDLPETTPERETVTRTTEKETTYIQTDNNDAEQNLNGVYLAIIGIVAVFLVAVVGILASRRESPYQP